MQSAGGDNVLTKSRDGNLRSGSHRFHYEASEGVGDRFPEEARRIHYGETKERGIRGRATPQAADELREEGIEVVALPMPEPLKGSIQ